ncbi:MAG: hypothetical protein Q9169_003696 [Polycauliona sp. 2 TL-2023]
MSLLRLQHSLGSAKSSNHYSSLVDAQYSAGPKDDIDKQAQLNEHRERQYRDWPRSKYSDVSVLLLRWAADNLGVIEEVTKLRDLFRDRFNFAVEIWDIPSEDPEDELTAKILQFRKGRGRGSLILLYYAGHGDGDPRQCIWAANTDQDSPRLNWHNIQGHLLGHPCDTLSILDCCYASLAINVYNTHDNWFLGASVKESQAFGVSWKSFTSAMLRRLERAANRYWDDRQSYDVQSLSHDLNFREQDLLVTPNLVRLSSERCDPTDLTPLLYPRSRTVLASARTEPVVNQTHDVLRKKSLPHHPRKGYDKTLSIGSTGQSSRRIDGQAPPQNDMIPFEVPTMEDCQTVRVSGLPREVLAKDVTGWLSEIQEFRPSDIIPGPVVQSSATGTSTMTLSFPSLFEAKQVLELGGEMFSDKHGRVGRRITMDRNLIGLTTIYSSDGGPQHEPNVDIVFVHGAYGHPINSFARHYLSSSTTEKSTELCWPRDELPKLLESGGIFPRISTYGWRAEAYLHPDGNIGRDVDNFIADLKDSRHANPTRPLILMGHGLGGLLVKEVVNSVINSSFSEERFENPVKACYFLAVPHRGIAGDEDFAPMLAAMKSMAEESTLPQRLQIQELTVHNLSILNSSTEFESICQEWGIRNICIAEKQVSIVPEKCAFLTQAPEDRIEVDGHHHDPSRLTRTAGLSKVVTERYEVLQQISNKIIDQLNPGKAATKKGEPTVAKKTEKVFARLQKYDTVFLVDDSESMNGRRWRTTCRVLDDIAKIAVKYDKDGVDIKFFNNYLDDDERKNLNTSEKVMDLFSKTQPDGPTLTADILDEELNEYMYEYEQDRHKKGLNLIVLTDGEPDKGQDVEGVIVKYAKLLHEAKAPSLHVGVQVVQIGNDPTAANFLSFLDRKLKGKHDLDRDMVDTVRWVSGDEDHLFEKILLGGILKRLDDDDEPDEDG